MLCLLLLEVSPLSYATIAACLKMEDIMYDHSDIAFYEALSSYTEARESEYTVFIMYLQSHDY